MPFGRDPQWASFYFLVLSVNFITFAVTSISKDWSPGGDFLLDRGVNLVESAVLERKEVTVVLTRFTSVSFEVFRGLCGSV